MMSITEQSHGPFYLEFVSTVFRYEKKQKKYFSVKKNEFVVLGGIKGIRVFLEDY